MMLVANKENDEAKKPKLATTVKRQSKWLCFKMFSLSFIYASRSLGR